MNQEWLIKLLKDIDQKKGHDFTGLGIVVYKDFPDLPVTSLKIINGEIALPISNYDLLVEMLVEVSKLTNPLHDGFHLISQEGKLTHLSQYFSTPIVEGSTDDFQHGSRHRTALYGSYLNSVLFCGICSLYESPVYYEHGNKKVL